LTARAVLVRPSFDLTVLANEGLNFTEILQQLRRDLAVRYFDDPKLDISKIAWLLGFNEVSAFTHTFKRWTGKTPSQMRTTAASSDFCAGWLER
jgi:AraC-like DNA-binding protein